MNQTKEAEQRREERREEKNTQIKIIGRCSSQYLLKGGAGTLRQAALHQVVPQLPQVEQLFSVVLHRRRHQLCLQANGEHRLDVHAVLGLNSHRETNVNDSTLHTCVVRQTDGCTSGWAGSSASNCDRILRVKRRI